MKENNGVMQGDNTARGPSASGADLSVGAVLNANTKENKIQEVKQSIAKVAENRTYKIGDEVKAYGKNCKIVEVLDVGRYHLKNLQEPYDSFIALVEEFE